MEATMTGGVIEDVLSYERERGPLHAGSLGESVLRKIVALAPNPMQKSVETGCGKSTVLLSQIGEHHVCFTVDDTSEKRGNLDFVRQCPSFRADKTLFVIGPTQRTLPTYKFDRPIDLALIDGGHGYPFPEMDYYYFYPHLRTDSVLIVDDIQIPTIGRLAEFLTEDEMFEPIHVEGNTAFYRRTSAETFNPEGDGWWLQRFNTRRLKQSTSRKWRGASRVRRLLGRLLDQLPPKY
jgi:hypothetical protein